MERGLSEAGMAGAGVRPARGNDGKRIAETRGGACDRPGGGRCVRAVHARRRAEEWVYRSVYAGKGGTRVFRVSCQPAAVAAETTGERIMQQKEQQSGLTMAQSFNLLALVA